MLGINSFSLTAILLLIAAAAGVWIFIAWRRTQCTFPQAVLYFINALITRLLWRTKVSGPLPIEPGKGAVVVSNHISGIDPLLIQVASSRVVHWMVAREYVEHWSMGWAFRILEVITVNRGGVDTAAIKQAIRLAQNGDCVGMFPEGRVNMEQDQTLLLPGRPGAAMVALRARVPVIPCYVSGAPYNGTALGSFFMLARARVQVGKPLDLSPWYDRADDREAQEELTKLFLQEIAKLAGRPDFEPKLAGRRWKTPEDEAADDLAV
jgi:1-acyl-sn-glycerol-3-phosphate acyltransferase